jgi:hypothetical protein
MSDGTLTQYVAEHPKLISVLFTVLVLLSQAGAVAAGGIHGP